MVEKGSALGFHVFRCRGPPEAAELNRKPHEMARKFRENIVTKFRSRNDKRRTNLRIKFCILCKSQSDVNKRKMYENDNLKLTC